MSSKKLPRIDPRPSQSAAKDAPDKPATTSFLLAPADQRLGNAIHGQSGSAQLKQVLLIEDPAVRAALRRIVMRMEENPHMREELLQEAFVHFWASERQHPGQKLGWYLQRVQFHLRHLRTSGRSLDSPRHRGAQAAFTESADGAEDWPDRLNLDEGIMSEVNAHDILCLLADRLQPMDRKILGALVDGLVIRDIAEKLHVSHMFVVRHRRQIARMAIELGIHPLQASLRQRTSSEKTKQAKV